MAVPGAALGRVALTLVAVAYAVAALTLLPPTPTQLTTYGAVSPSVQALDHLAGLSLLAAGVATAWWGPSWRAGLLLVGAGVLWYAPDWSGWEGGPAVVRGLGTVAAPSLPVLLLLLLLLLAPAGHRRARAIGAAAGTLSLALAVALVTVDDPLLDQDCWPTCSSSAFLVAADPSLAGLLTAGAAVTWAVVSGGAAVAAGVRWWRATVAARRWQGGLLGAVVLAGAAELAFAVATLLDQESAASPLFVTLHVVRALAWTVVAVTSGRTTWRHLTRRHALAVLVRDLEVDDLGRSLTAVLRDGSGDHDVEVVYPVGIDGRHVTADGLPATADAGRGRVATRLVHGDEVLAVVVHDPTVLPVPVLEASLGPAARLALENDRLSAERLARVHDVRDSRRRIVAAGDEARRRLERDLHDGAQQSLLALSSAVAVARATARRSDERVAVAELDRGVDEAGAALAALRRLADGIHPAVLTASGLGPALRSLADRAPIPVELELLTTDRFPPSLELAAYSLVVGALDEARDQAHDGTASLVVRVLRASSLLVVEVDGAGRQLPASVLDRAGALGGQVVATARGVRLELPCAS